MAVNPPAWEMEGGGADRFSPVHIQKIAQNPTNTCSSDLSAVRYRLSKNPHFGIWGNFVF